MKKTTQIILLTALVFLSGFSLKAQYTRSDFDKHFYIGLNGGPNIFIGDIKEYKLWPVTTNKNEVRFGGSGFIGYQFTPVFSIRGQALYGELAGTKRDINRFFQATILEGNLSAVINISNWFGGYRPDRSISFFGFGGVGFANYKSRLEELNSGKVIKEKGYDDGFGIVGTKLAGIVPLGLGANLMLSHNLKLSFESSIHITNTDYFDNTTGIDWPVDMYNYSSLGLIYQFKGKPTPREKTSPPDFAKKTEQEEETQEPKEEKDMEYKPLIDHEAINEKKTENETEEKPEEEVKKFEIPIEEIVEEVVEEIPENTFYYSVQVCAQRTGELNQSFFRNKFDFEMPLNESMYNGYYIYTTGQFQTYNEAKQLRNMIRAYNNIPGAFVVAFKNGERMGKLP